MKAAIAFILLLLAVSTGSALADGMVFRDSKVTVTLLEASLRACWTASGQHVIVMDEAGSGGLLPIAGFKRSPSI